jgi:hypothetical protein
MATYNKFNQFTKDLIDGIHDFDAHVFKVMLTNTAPIATNTIRANLTEITAGSGYTSGGTATTITTSTASGVAKVTGTDVVFTSSGTIGPFRYAVLYNDTSPSDSLIGWWDYSASISLLNTETLTVDFDATNGILTVT